ncbi:hypothetical protein TIFTF001_055997 [Ficus carica]|jgi:hypothetical protein|uniref:Uncharacterized protein n=1 Tax=Ficus carica TaxID=3494 RepID=A0AA88EFH8_FICCA|nr:hypothetical protein TIFTF001_055997 [Ficus carica]
MEIVYAVLLMLMEANRILLLLMAFSFMSTNRLQYRDSAFMAAKRPSCPYLYSIIIYSHGIPSDRRATWHCVEHLEPDRNGSACPAQARISTSPSFVLCEHYGSFHSQICGRLDLGLNLKVNGDMNCSGTLGMDPGGTKSPLSMRINVTSVTGLDSG